MPTFDVAARFWSDWRRLTPAQQVAFLSAKEAFVADLDSGRGFRRSLRVKGVQGSDGLFEMSWAGDGRATFEYGRSRRRGQPHIVWRRIGTHAVIGVL